MSAQENIKNDGKFGNPRFSHLGRERSQVANYCGKGKFHRDFIVAAIAEFTGK